MTVPTELQWEYGARGGTTTPWWTGRTIDSVLGKENVWPKDERPHDVPLPVGSLEPIPFGLFDTLGNLSEWCLDEYRVIENETPNERDGDGLRLYKTPWDPTHPSPLLLARASRGGSFATKPDECKVAKRLPARIITDVFLLSIRPVFDMQH